MKGIGLAAAAAISVLAALPAAAQQQAPVTVPGLTIGFAIPKPPALIFATRDVADMDRAVAFYTKALGMKVVGGNEPPGTSLKEVFLGFDTEALSAKLLLAHDTAKPAPKGHGEGTRLIISVADLAATVQRVTAAGGKVTHAPRPPVNIAHVTDPDGYGIELTQP